MEFPAQFGRYQLLERIATGGMAEVFLARSFGVEGFEKRLVIKRILPELAQNPRFVGMFVHEAKLSVCLNHPNIVQVFDLGKVGDDPFIAMEHIHGRDLTLVLRALRRDGQRLPVRVSASIAASVARGLAYAHARTSPDGTPLHIIHRDVSPHNIVVSFEGDVKLVDFGIARLAGESTAEGIASNRPGGGKFAYMSPEQAEGRTADARSDIFSLGVVLFEMLAGRRLFADGDPDEKLRAVIACEVPDVRDLNPEVPEALAAILARTLARDPLDRYPTAAQLEDDLRAFLFETSADAGFRGDAALRAEVLRRLFPDFEGGQRGGAELDQLAEDLRALHGGGSRPEPSAASTPPDTSASASDDRAPQLLAIRGERRSVVVLVVEVNGLTDVSARTEAEEIARMHYRMLRMARGLIDRMGGVAGRFDDDTLLVFFGLPRALGDDLDRALACAREFHRLAARLRRRGVAVEFSVGVHVGDLTVAPTGKRYRFSARGDTLKSTVRLAYAAEPGTTLVSDRVASLAGDRFPFDRGPELRRKGARGLRRSFVLAGGPRQGARGASGRWFRRGDELEVLRDAITALREGSGARIAVTGDAGTGKSRLFRELRELAARRGIPVFHGRAVPYGSDRPLAPFRDLLSDILGIHPDTATSAIRERLARLGELKLDPNDIAVIGSLWAVELGPRGEPGKEAMFVAAAKLVRGLAADGPVIVLLEDLQYLDALERSLFDQLVRTAEGERVLLIASWRGGLPDELGARMHEVRLGPLGPDQVQSMAADLLGAHAIGPDLSRLLQRTAEGNPLYIEEILKALHQAGRIWHEGSTARLRDPQVDPGLPPTLQGLIAARIDLLDPAARGALQVAAVLGPSFSGALLGAAVGADDPAVLLGELVRAGLITPEDRGPDTGWAFASILVWECVIRSILGIQRREYHRMVAAGMERLYGDRLHTVVEAYAGHCHAGGRVRDAAEAVLRAGQGQQRAQFLEGALACHERGIAWLRAAPKDQDDPELDCALHVCAGEVALLLGGARAEKLFQVALDIATELGLAHYESRALLGLGEHYLAQGKASLARPHLDAAASLARRLGDARPLVRCLEASGALALEEGRTDDARAAYEEGLRVAGPDRALAARMLLGLGNHALRRDDNAVALSLLSQALPHAEEAGDRILLGRIVNNLGIVYFSERRWDEALVQFRRALELRQGLGYRVGEITNLHNIGDALFRRGDFAHAHASFEQSRDLARECGWERGVVMNEVFLCYLRGLRGENVADALDRAAKTAARLADRESAILARSFAARLQGAAGERALRAAEAEARAAGLASLARQIAEEPRVGG